MMRALMGGVVGLALAACGGEEPPGEMASVAGEDPADEAYRAESARLAGGTCPPGSDTLGAPPPHGSGVWCQRIDGDHLTAHRLDGTLWMEATGMGAEGPVFDGHSKVYAADGTTVVFEIEKRDGETIRRTEHVPGGASTAPPGVPTD